MKKKTELKSGDYGASFNNYVYSAIAKNSTCLDVGCWTGNLGKRLIREKNCTVDGVDFLTDVLKEAQKKAVKDKLDTVEGINLDWSRQSD